MRIVLFISCVFISITAYGQALLNGRYLLNDINDDIECYIKFYRSGHYYIGLSQNSSSDIVETLVLSYGNYSLKNSDLTLVDALHHYKMSLIISNNTILVNDSFWYLKSNRFDYSNEISAEDSVFFEPPVDTLKFIKKRNSYIDLKKTMFPLSNGVYNSNSGFSISIENNHEYKMLYKDITLSRGLWSRDGNIMALWDSDIKHSFYLLIDGKGLISNLLPGDYKGCFLEYEENH